MNVLSFYFLILFDYAAFHIASFVLHAPFLCDSNTLAARERLVRGRPHPAALRAATLPH
jgi:hypothetical protein